MLLLCLPFFSGFTCVCVLFESAVDISAEFIGFAAHAGRYSYKHGEK